MHNLSGCPMQGPVLLFHPSLNILTSLPNVDLVTLSGMQYRFSLLSLALNYSVFQCLTHSFTTTLPAGIFHLSLSTVP